MNKSITALARREARRGSAHHIIYVGVYSNNANPTTLMLMRGAVVVTANDHERRRITSQHAVMLPRHAVDHLIKCLLNSPNIDQPRTTWLITSIDLARDASLSNDFWGAWLEQSPTLVTNDTWSTPEELKSSLLAFQPTMPSA